MSEPGRPDIDEANKTFSTDVYSADELRERRAQARRDRRKKIVRRTRNTVLGTAGAGLAALAIDRGLDRDQAALERSARQAAPIERELERRQQANANRESEVSASATQSGEIDVSEAGVTGSVDLDSDHPDDMTTPTGTGGVPAEREPGTGGVASS